MVETIADLYERLSETADEHTIGLLIAEYAKLRDVSRKLVASVFCIHPSSQNINSKVVGELSQFIQNMPSTASNCKEKLNCQITELTKDHIHKQIQDILALVEKSA